MGSTRPKLAATTTLYARTDSDRTAQTLESRLRHHSTRPQPARQRVRQAAMGWVHQSCQIDDSAAIDDCSPWASRTHNTFELPSTSSSRRFESTDVQLSVTNHVGDGRRKPSPSHSRAISHDAISLLSLRKGGSFLRFVLPHTWGRPIYYYFYYYCHTTNITITINRPRA